MVNKKLTLLALVVAGIAVFYFFDFQQHLSLESLKINRDRLDVIYRENSVAVISLFIGIYFLVVALSLPGATILTLAAGAIFGSALGTFIVNIGATLGATVAFLVARFILRDWVENRFSDKLEPINKGISENGIWGTRCYYSNGKTLEIESPRMVQIVGGWPPKCPAKY